MGTHVVGPSLAMICSTMCQGKAWFTDVLHT